MGSICVFCGSSDGASPLFGGAAAEMGRLIAQRGITLVYGGGNVGTMGTLADAAMREGGKVIGIIPTRLNEMVDHLDLTELYVVKDMHERKALMQDKADAFIALPGGIGTMEELFEVWAWRYIGYHSKPVGIVNIGGFYDDLLGMLARMAEDGFLKKEMLDDLCVAKDPSGILEALELKVASGKSPMLKINERQGKNIKNP
ncbi:MAG: TIGR00730 family Rossman fold protein [Spirochaetae bacterium HGW-Spirochaetae-9]|nr:MAG: TIGR00730 family Rossman fold protein [Spirochaetae bacterium HGW-Spirochaetae-9]